MKLLLVLMSLMGIALSPSSQQVGGGPQAFLQVTGGGPSALIQQTGGGPPTWNSSGGGGGQVPVVSGGSTWKRGAVSVSIGVTLRPITNTATVTFTDPSGSGTADATPGTGGVNVSGEASTPDNKYRVKNGKVQTKDKNGKWRNMKEVEQFVRSDDVTSAPVDRPPVVLNFDSDHVTSAPEPPKGTQPRK